jgi:predicted nuclease of predicted toxin-antitoxin system
MKFKLDENLSPSLSSLLVVSGHDAHSVTQQALGGQPDHRVIEVCRREGRALITLDLDFANIQAYPPTAYLGIIVLRLATQDNLTAEAAVRRLVAFLAIEEPQGALWIVENDRIRIHRSAG